MAQFSVPKSPAKQIINIDNFLGVDFTNSPANISDDKSPMAVNMIRDVPGKVRKRMGYEKVMDFNNSSLIRNHWKVESAEDVTQNTYTFHTDVDNGYYTASGEFHQVPQIIPIGAVELEAGEYTFLVFRSGEVAKEDFTEKINIGGEITLDDNFDEPYVKDVELTETTTIPIQYSPSITATYTDYKLKIMVIYKSQYHEGIEWVKYSEPLTNLKINGYHFRTVDDTPLYHVGKSLIKDNMEIYSDMADAISHSWCFNDNLYIIDGYKILKYDGEEVHKIDEDGVGYVPTITIAKAPTGGGQQYEDLNLISDAFIEMFLGTANVKTYQLTFGDLNDKAVKVWLLNNQGEFVEKTEGTDFTVNRTTGVVTFVNAPGPSPLTGEDNVKIQAHRNVEGYADRINHCTIGTRFGVNGAFDRLFLAGNPDYPNSDWYSQQWDATYFPDTGYSLIGSSASAIVGYSIVSNYLATHKDEYEKDLSIVIREGDLVENEPSFKIVNTLQGAGAIAPNSFNYLKTEPLFLTRSGLYAVTAQDITGEKYAQSRSFFLNGKMLEEDFQDLKNSISIVYNDMYLLHVNHNLYILDGLQPIRTDKSEPYATRQYAAFYCDNLPIRYMWERENRLFFGDEEGHIFRFYNDKDNTLSYNDNGEPINAYWETADFEGQYFYKNKSFRYIAVKLGTAVATSLKLLGQRKGVWSQIKEDNTRGRYFSYTNLIYSKFSYSTDTTERIIASKLSIKKVDKARFRLVNDKLNEPFSIFAIALEYTTNNNVKG